MLDETVSECELKPLRSINDNHEKIILTMDKFYSNNTTEDGIKIKYLVDFYQKINNI